MTATPEALAILRQRLENLERWPLSCPGRHHGEALENRRANIDKLRRQVATLTQGDHP